MEFAGEPQHLGRGSGTIPAVGVVEGQLERPDELDAEVAGLREARHFLEAKVGTQGRLQGRQIVDVVLRGIPPVAGAFRPAAVRRERLHGQDDRLAAVVEDLPGQGRLLVGDGQGADGHAAVADLVPVMVGLRPALAALVDLQARFQTFLHQRLADGGPVLRRQEVKQPVVADGQCVGHLGGVEEVGRVPVGEGGGREHLLAGPLGLAPVTVQPVKPGQGADAPQRRPALAQQARPDELVLDGRLGEHLPGLRLQPLVPVVDQRILRRRLLDPFQLLIQDIEARVLRPQVF